MRRTAAVAVLVVATLAGCGGAAPEGPEAYTPGNLLAQALGIPTDPVEQRRQELAVQDAIAACMRREGFEYVPFEPSSQTDEGPEYGEIEYGERYGYGVMRAFELTGGDPSLDPRRAGPPDPNIQIVAGLTPDEQREYDRAMYGTGIEFDDGGDAVAPPLGQRGCTGSAQRDVIGDDPASDPAVRDLLEQFNATEAEARVYTSKWIDCMKPAVAELAHDVELREIYDGRRVISLELYVALGLEIVETDTPEEEAAIYAGGRSFVSGWSDANGVGTWVFDVDGRRELTGAQIDGLTERELALWKADYDCQHEVGYRDYLQQREQAVAADIAAALG